MSRSSDQRTSFTSNLQSTLSAWMSSSMRCSPTTACVLPPPPWSHCCCTRQEDRKVRRLLRNGRGCMGVALVTRFTT
ncbi:hypothetical protein DPMN_145521 [Dreissena polymorpha]|uniref:Uncharacterized protein n=1 Tax=Dreissena polymorpha TaxID=45954 RepID=A0A9D4FA21_DREPO|nr:hypothetical protein DPMN_145521 [Dreissena polymorpha]